METKKGPVEIKPYERGFHPLYLWGVVYVLLTYLYPFLPAIVSEDTVIGGVLSLVCMCVPLILLAVNTIIAIRGRYMLDRIYFLNTALIIKYGLIPFYLIGGLFILLFALLTFTPVVIMIFVGPAAVIMLSVLGWISMVGSAPLILVYLYDSVKAGRYKKAFAVCIGIMQFFFGLDVLGAVISTFREKRLVKLTIGIFVGLLLLLLGLIAWLVLLFTGA